MKEIVWPPLEHKYTLTSNFFFYKKSPVSAGFERVRVRTAWLATKIYHAKNVGKTKNFSTCLVGIQKVPHLLKLPKFW
jgi:hypothetical protein